MRATDLPIQAFKALLEPKTKGSPDDGGSSEDVGVRLDEISSTTGCLTSRGAHRKGARFLRDSKGFARPEVRGVESRPRPPHS